MSLLATGRHIECDGEGCQARAEAPVALRPTLTGDRAVGAEGRIEGWLFVARHGECRHYCPACSATYLESFEDCRPET